MLMLEKKFLSQKCKLFYEVVQTISGSNFIYKRGAMLSRGEVGMTETLASLDSQIKAFNPFGPSCAFKL